MFIINLLLLKIMVKNLDTRLKQFSVVVVQLLSGA